MPENPQSSFAVSRYFLEHAKRDGVSDVTPMKILKLVYLAHGWVLGFMDKPLIAESVEAWKFGPVIPSVYHYFKRFGGETIPFSEEEVLPRLELDDEANVVVGGVWKAHRTFSGAQLSSMTHERNTPWYEAWHNKGGSASHGVIIDNMRIRDYYRSLIEEARQLAKQASDKTR